MRKGVFTLRNGLPIMDIYDPDNGILLSKEIDYHFSNFSLGFYQAVAFTYLELTKRNGPQCFTYFGATSHLEKKTFYLRRGPHTNESYAFLTMAS